MRKKRPGQMVRRTNGQTDRQTKNNIPFSRGITRTYNLDIITGILIDGKTLRLHCRWTWRCKRCPRCLELAAPDDPWIRRSRRGVAWLRREKCLLWTKLMVHSERPISQQAQNAYFRKILCCLPSVIYKYTCGCGHNVGRSLRTCGGWNCRCYWICEKLKNRFLWEWRN